MHGRLLLLTALASIGLAAPAAASAQEVDVSTRVIGQGAMVAGVDVSDLTVAQAAVVLEQRLGAAVLTPVTVKTARRTFTLGGERAQVKLDALTSAKRAYYAARDAGAPTATGTVRQEGGTLPGLTVEPKLTYSKRAVREWTGNVRDAVTRAPRNATFSMSLTRMRIKSARKGRTIDAEQLAAKVGAQLADPLAPRTVIRQRIVRTKPAVNNQTLRRVNGTALTVDRSSFKLRLFKGLKLAKTYSIALGMAGHDTPNGRYSIQNKAVNPAWHVPNSAWAGSLAGSVVPGGAPNNPLKARWLGIVNGVGIHGTAEEWSIGTQASHGCIRMRVADVIDLYPRVPVGTPVLIG